MCLYLFFLQDRSNAQSSCAGLFIGAHLGFDFPGVWIHVDMAYPAYSVSYSLHTQSNDKLYLLL